ncbi:MAG: universal stress protein [Chitinophagaceae bacterium]
MKTIIIATDFSSTADNALDYGIAMAKKINADITLFHVYQIPIATTNDTPIVIVAEEDMRKAAEKNLSRLKSEIESKEGNLLKVNTELRIGDIVTELEEFGQKVQPFAIIMGSNWHSGIDQALFGSITLKSIRHITTSIIAVPPAAKFKEIKKVGFACDYKKVVETTPIITIKELVETFNAELHIINVNKETHTAATKETSLVQNAFRDISPSYHFIKDETVEDGVSNFAEINQIDLLVAIPKKHNLWDSLFHKSATKQLVFHSHIPVLCIHE